MKKNNRSIESGVFFHTMKIIFLTFFTLAMIFPTASFAQDEAEEKSNKDLRPVRNMFESNWLIDNQTVIVPIKGTMEMDMMHRFGVVNNGYEDFFGLYAPSNIRIGLTYVPVKNLQVGFGFTKERLLWDFNVKYAFVEQKRKGGFPVSITGFANVALDTRKAENFQEKYHRFTYFYQVMVARQFHKRFSLQVGASMSHFNVVSAQYGPETNYEVINDMKNDHFAINVLTRIGLTRTLSLIINYDQPLTDHLLNKPKPNISFGLAVSTSSHSFQFFAGNYKSIVPQYNNFLNQNDPGEGMFLLGFNITRLWNF